MEKNGNDIVFVATDETIDRHNESIPMDSWDVENYMQAPRLLVDHDHRVEKIVGKATDIKLSSKRMTFKPVFHGITQLSREVEQMVLDDVLNTVSVGFIPHPPAKGEEYGKNELVEISFVTVPANPSAQRIKSLLGESETEEQKQVVEKFLNDEVEKELEGTVRFKAIEVQTLVFSKSKFNDDEAKQWATDHGFKADAFEKGDATITIEQFAAEKCVEGSERTIQLEEGVKAIVCRNDAKACTTVEEKDVAAPDIVTDEHSEKQPQALTSPSVEGEKKSALSKEDRRAKIAHASLKQVTRILNHALREINQES